MRLLQIDDMAWFIIHIPCWYTMQTITDGWYDMIYNWVLWVWKRIVATLVSEDSLPRWFQRIRNAALLKWKSYCGVIIKIQEIILYKSVPCGLEHTICQIHLKLYSAIFRFELILHLNGFRTLTNIDDVPKSSCLPNCALVQSYFGLCFLVKSDNLILILNYWLMNIAYLPWGFCY